MKKLKSFESFDNKPTDSKTNRLAAIRNVGEIKNIHQIREEEEDGEIMEEGVGSFLKKTGEFLGLKGMPKRIDDIFGFSGDNFTPTSKLKTYLSQGSISDMSLVESSLRKAREIGYGVGFTGDESDLSEMEGTDEEKNISRRLIKRALHSIHTTSRGGHDFGAKPTINNESISRRSKRRVFESTDDIDLEIPPRRKRRPDGTLEPLETSNNNTIKTNNETAPKGKRRKSRITGNWIN